MKENSSVNDMTFPLRDIPESSKDDKYHVQWARAMYNKWHSDRAAIPYSYKSTIAMLRAYGKGAQPITQYIKQKADKPTNTNSTYDTPTYSGPQWERDGTNNVDINIISVAPRVKSMIKAYLNNIQEDVMVDTIDPVSGAKQDDAKWRSLFYTKNKKFIEDYEKAAGMEPDEPDFLPESVEEVEMYQQAGGFKLAEAMDMERLVKYTMEISGYDDELTNQLLDDALDVGIVSTKKRLDPEDNKFRDYYIDIENLAVQSSRHNDFHDIEWVGHLEFYTISKLKQHLPNEPESFFREIANNAKGQYSNPQDFSKHNTLTNFGAWGYDEFSVPVFEAEWKDWKFEQAVFYDNKNGKTSQLPVNEETTSNLSSRKRYVKSNLEVRRECSWLVGTDKCFGADYVNMQDRPAKNKTISNYNIRALADAPIIYQLRTVLDDMQVSWLRFQDDRANAIKSATAVNISKLSAISDGKQTYTVADILSMMKKSRLLLYKDSFSGKYEGGKTLPIDHIPSTFIESVNEFVTTWDHALKRMEDLTGVNALMLGATPDPDAPVGTQKLSVASSASALRAVGIAINGVKRTSAESFMRRFTLACKARADIIKSYEGVIGRVAIERLIEAGKTMTDYGMFFHPRPSESEKAALLDSANISLENSREGKPGIDLQTYMFIQEQLYAGVNLKWLRIYIGFKEKELTKKDHERKLELIEAQGNKNLELENTKGQNQSRNKQQEVQGDIAVKQQEAKGKVTEQLVGSDPEVADTVAKRMGLKNAQQSPLQVPQPQNLGTSQPQGGNVPLAP